jgi:hypothetical protein
MGEPDDLEFRFVNGRVQFRRRRMEENVGAMGRLRDFGRDAASYFGLGESPDGAHESGDDGEPWWHSALAIGALLPMAFLLREELGFEDDFVGFLAMVVIAAVLASVLGLGIRLFRRLRRKPESPGAGPRP